MKHWIRWLLLAVACFDANAGIYFGGYDCGQWLKDPPPQAKAWLLGYLSGINYAVSRQGYDPLDQLASAEQAYAWMDNYCRADPLSTINKGGQALYEELMRRAKGK